MSQNYSPPKQGFFGQIFDTVLILVLVYASLMMPLFMKEAPVPEAAKTAEVSPAVTWESLGQNKVMQAQWVKLGHNPETAAVIINNRFDYTIDPLMLIITIIVVVGYFVLVLKVSDKQYREVIAEKFD